jgi:hypothetical protein
VNGARAGAAPSGGAVTLRDVHEDAIERARARLRDARSALSPAASEAALERARLPLEELAETAARLEATLPDRVDTAIRDGLRAEAAPVARHLAEVRGLSAQTVRRLERIEAELLAERAARIDDLNLLVELIATGWKAVEARLARIEAMLEPAGEGVVLRMSERSG